MHGGLAMKKAAKRGAVDTNILARFYPATMRCRGALPLACFRLGMRLFRRR